MAGFCSSQPVVPQTTGILFSKQVFILLKATSGCENSITTSGLFRFSLVGVSFNLATTSCPLFVAISSMILPIFP